MKLRAWLTEPRYLIVILITLVLVLGAAVVGISLACAAGGSGFGLALARGQLGLDEQGGSRLTRHDADRAGRHKKAGLGEKIIIFLMIFMMT